MSIGEFEVAPLIQVREEGLTDNAINPLLEKNLAPKPDNVDLCNTCFEKLILL
jgi:hypothetical protein